MGSLIRATNLWGYVDLVRELGGDPLAMLEGAGITPGVEYEDDTFVALASFVRLLEATADRLHCPDLGLRLSRWQGLPILGPVAVIARNSRSVRDGLEAIARYLYTHSPALTLEVQPRPDSGVVRFVYSVSELPLVELHQGYELSMANGARLLRLLGGDDARPSVVSLLHEQLGLTASYDEALGCPVRFGQSWCGFEVPAALADRVIDDADPEARRIATKYLESLSLPTTSSLADQVAALSRRLLSTGHCTAETVAEQLRMHPRTLQRRLHDEGVRFQELLDVERRQLAVRYLAEPMLELSQVAALLGYAEQSTLNRSFQRWFGTTPGRYRARLRS